MIERYENALQIAVLLCCVPLAVYRAVPHRSRPWALLAFFYGNWLLGDLFWLFCLLLTGKTPEISIVSDLSWYASYLFLYLLLREMARPEPGGSRQFLPWLGFAFAFGMAAFYMQWGEYLSNLIYAVLMGLLLYAAIRRLINRSRNPGCVSFSVLVLVFCLLEYALWTASCFRSDESLSNPYFWFDALLTVSFPFFLPAVKKAVTE